ncbi:MAG: YceI family protein [Actinomycetota bacterium]
MRIRPGHRLRWILGGVAVAITLAFGGPYVFIHFIEGEAPAALAASPSAAVQPATGSVAGNWLVTDGSQAGYRVEEVLNGQSTTAVGRTTAVTGGLSATATKVTEAKFTVDLTKVASDQARRDGQFQDRIMQTSQFPTASFTLVDPVDLATLATAAGTRTLDVQGTLALHGTTKDVTVPLTLVRSGATLTISGQVPVVFADYGIDNPSFGFVKTEDHGAIEVLLHLTKA